MPPKKTPEIDYSIADVLAALKSQDKKLDALSADIRAVEKLTAKTDKKYEELNKKLDTQLNDNTVLREELCECKGELKECKEEIDSLKKSIASKDEESKIVAQRLINEKRALNMVIDGIPEVKGEKMHLVMNNFLSDLGASFSYSATNSALRFGARAVQDVEVDQRKQPREQYRLSNRPRPVLLRLATRQQKMEIFGKSKDIRKITKWGNVFCNDDLTKGEQLQRRELRSVAAFARSDNIECTVRGNNIIVRGVKYTYADVHTLPHGLSLEKAAIRKTPDGWAFQGHGAFCSNLFPCELEDNNGKYRSVEHMLAVTAATECNDNAALGKLITETNPYSIKRIYDAIKKTPAWNADETAKLTSMVQLKFRSRPDLLTKLKKLDGNLYEATLSQKYGCGFNIREAFRIEANSVKVGHQNRMGAILADIRRTN